MTLTTTQNDWYAPLRGVASLGSLTAKVRRLADLHEARERHLSQFFTPTEAALYMWRIAEQAMDPVFAENPDAQVAILDNSIGSGRLIQFANPAQHRIAGIDVDAEKLALLGVELARAGFQHDLLHAGMEEVHPRGFGVALINPPFSCHLESPLLEPYICNSRGRFGPGTSALSHHYALHQALDAAETVVALMPRTAADEIRTDPIASERLLAVLPLPGDTFESEGANVATTILVFGPHAWDGAVLEQPILDFAAPPPALGVSCRTAAATRPRSLNKRSTETETPSIVAPVTGDATVRVVRKGSEFRLQFRCGLVEAKVRNALLEAQIENDSTEKHRYPNGIEFHGQGIFDIELHLMQPDPLASFANLLKRIRLAGGRPQADAGILPHLERLRRRRAIENTPTRHWIWVPPGGDMGASLEHSSEFTAAVRTSHLVDAKRWGSPRLLPGDKTQIQRVKIAEGERFQYGKGAFSTTITRAELLERFEVEAASATEGRWLLKHPGRRVAFPGQAQELAARARALKIDSWLNWGFQLEDLIEASLTRGAVIGWEPGLGKGRLTVALALIAGGRRNLLVVEAQLLDEVRAELVKVNLDPSLWQVIETPEALQNLRRINVISYTRLRMELSASGKDPGEDSEARPRGVTYAKRLRNRIHTVVADEGHAIASEYSLQVQALYQVSPKRRFATTGTPIGNYPRSLLPLAVWAVGDGTASQIFGRRRPYMEPRLLNSMSFAQRGYDAFRIKHCVIAWSTFQFQDDFVGGKREIPALAGVDDFRHFAGKLVLRRTWKEPEVREFIKIPDPVFSKVNVDWDDAHLSMYLAVAEEFAQWWREARRRAGDDGKHLNMVGVLARIGAVFRAANYPQGVEWGGPRFAGRTSKQRAVVEQLAENHVEGRKTILFATSPDVLAMLSRDLRERGVDSVLYTGRIPLKARTRALNEQFRYGSCSTLLTSFGVGQTGLNLHVASDEIFYNRCWSPRQELQALYRALRPQQTQEVRVSHVHLAGSLDEYQAMMCEMKADSAQAGLDFCTPEFSAQSFTHWLAILDMFCERLSTLRGVKRHSLREVLSNAA